MSNEHTLPPGRYLSVTWAIPRDFGGMTTAFLRRNRAFQSFGGTVVDVLTFDTQPHYPELERELRERGLLTRSARILNLWDWLREHPVTAPEPISAPAGFDPLDASPAYATTQRAGVVLTRTRADASGEALQVDHYRLDGSLLASDRRDFTSKGTIGGRSIVLCDEAGRPVRRWSSPSEFYRHWVDAVRACERAVIIVDSKTAARFMAGYRRPGVTTVHVLHGSHLNDRGTGLRASRDQVLPRLGDFDLAVTLTERQRRDIRSAVPGARNVVCIPNSVEPARPSPARAEPRDPANVTVLASLTPSKRVSHAIMAVASLQGSTPAPRLTVYGEGPQRPKLEALIARLGAADCVTLAGHAPGAERHLDRAPAVLLTSHSEGFGLVLLEAMAHGAIPIAYDVPYGPAELIEHGVNGFLVPDGDTDTLAAALAEALALAPDELERMRAAGRETVARYSDEAVMRRWSRALRHATGFAGRLGRLRRRAGPGVRRLLRPHAA
jgi:poly(glycerol-phosphate) alpha-glucosyltransferase